MKSRVRDVTDRNHKYKTLTFCCPGCAEILGGGVGLHMLPVSGDKQPQWSFDGNTEAPTLSPSILSSFGDRGSCHSFIKNGRFEFLPDCTHSLAGQTIEMPDLPDWAVG